MYAYICVCVLAILTQLNLISSVSCLSLVRPRGKRTASTTALINSLNRDKNREQEIASISLGMVYVLHDPNLRPGGFKWCRPQFYIELLTWKPYNLQEHHMFHITKTSFNNGQAMLSLVFSLHLFYSFHRFCLALGFFNFYDWHVLLTSPCMFLTWPHQLCYDT